MSRPHFLLLVPPISAALVSPGFALTYLDTAQAQQAIFPGKSFTRLSLELSEAQKEAVKNKSGVRLTGRSPQIWKVSGGGWFIVDEVIGKHEFITYAIGLTGEGAVRSIEIMDYRESYGSQVRDSKWRAQFIGKSKSDPLQLDRDIKNISGATLSSRHLTDGVRRVLALYDVALR